MIVLATLPMTAWYAIPFPVGLGYAIVLFLSIFTIAYNKFKINVLPATFWIVFAYVCLMWAYNNGFALWSFIPPGGWIFFIFVLALLWGVITFDLDLLKKYLRWIVIFSAILFWVQMFLMITNGANVVSFVPNLTGSFTYEELTYSELVANQLSSSRPCSIFLEPSYMAYYYMTYLAILWFGDNLIRKWFTLEIIFIIITLVALRSGSGMIALAILIFAKILWFLNKAPIRKRLLVIFIAVPLIALSAYLYVNSEIGQAMLERTEEFTTYKSSGFTRVVGGYLMFALLNGKEKMFGIPNPRETFEVIKSDGGSDFYANGVQTILLSLGYIGGLLYLLFYGSVFVKVSFCSRICLIILLILSLLESNYLNPYMMLLTIIPCADYHLKKSILKKQ